MPSPAEISIYVHVPFCVVKCGYCDFNSYALPNGDRGLMDRFLDGLERELSMLPLRERPLSIFLGGGTPTYLDEARLARLFEVLGKHLDLNACPEVTMEANPESVTAQKARLARQAGVNRISLGAQSFLPKHLEFLDRAHNASQTEAAFTTFREAGFQNISLDLMFGIPGQTLAEWSRDLEIALELGGDGPDHLSCYNLTFEPGTRLHRDLVQGKIQTNGEQLDREMFLHTREVLTACGFVPYEISNFAGRGGRCQHNDHYWLQGDYLGVGPGASSHHQGVRSENLKPVHAWAEALARGQRPTASAETLTIDQRAAEALWLGLRRTEGISMAAISHRLQTDVATRFLEPINKLVAKELLRRQGSRLSLTDRGLLFANTVGEAFLVHET
ncbi:MAG: radical SAM family heme chaperone HemW [Planctomycetota bacterium]